MPKKLFTVPSDVPTKVPLSSRTVGEEAGPLTTGLASAAPVTTETAKRADSRNCIAQRRDLLEQLAVSEGEGIGGCPRLTPYPNRIFMGLPRPAPRRRQGGFTSAR